MECSLAFNSMLSLKMAVIGAEIAELVQLRTINRVFSATWTGENFTFATKWKRVMGLKVSSKRHDTFRSCTNGGIRPSQRQS
ncbi:hypothetical protein Plhal703r1_c38g0134391 [Plasmopara halstedii]